MVNEEIKKSDSVIDLINEAFEGYDTPEYEELVKEGIIVDIGKTKADKKILTEVKKTDRELAVHKKLVPKERVNDSFDADRIMNRIKMEIKASGNSFRVDRFEDYIEACHSILSALRTGNLPDRSWLIGAPNGFGKTTFVTECIMTMMKKGMRTVPYVSLSELADIKRNNELRASGSHAYKRVASGRESESYEYFENDDIYYEKRPIYITGAYSLSEYIDSECLFCCLTDISSKSIESRILYYILTRRAIRGLPTICMIQTAITPYLNDKALKEYIWDEILDVTGSNKGVYDRLSYISCYKVKRNTMSELGER